MTERTVNVSPSVVTTNRSASLTNDETRVFTRTGSENCATYASRYLATSSLTGNAYGWPGNGRPGSEL
jgi:hypothetical protein